MINTPPRRRTPDIQYVRAPGVSTGQAETIAEEAAAAATDPLPTVAEVQAMIDAAVAAGIAAALADADLSAEQVRYFIPAAFAEWLPFAVRHNADTGKPEAYVVATGEAFDVADYAPAAGVTYYVGYPGASDNNNGSTTGTSFGTIAKALTMSDVGTIIVSAGTLLFRSSGFPLGTNGKSVTIKSSDVTPFVMSNHDNLVYTPAGSGAYKSVRSTVLSVWDAQTPDANGDYVRLTERASVAEVQANAGSWYLDVTGASSSGVANTLYVKTSDARDLQNVTNAGYVRAYLNQAAMVFKGPVTCYLENCRVEGGSHACNVLQSSGRPSFYAKDVKFKYSGSTTAGNGIHVQGGKTYLQNCLFAMNALDGANYHLNGSVECESVEIDCEGRHNGWGSLTETCNGSTSHDGQEKMFRVGGDYHHNKGPNLVDVDGATSHNIGCLIHESTATGGNQGCNVEADGTIWLDACRLWGSEYDIVMDAANSTVYTRNVNSTSPGGDSVVATSAIVPY